MTDTPGQVLCACCAAKAEAAGHRKEKPKPKSALQQEAIALKAYNEERRAMGKDALSYGMWAAKGKPRHE